MINTEKLGTQHNWKPLPEAEAKRVMAIYEKELPSWVKKEGDEIHLYTKKGELIAGGYTRVVIGHYGSYFEFDKDKEQIYTYNLVVKKGQEYRLLPKYAGVKYNWLCLKDDESIKVYFQRGTVSYADYKVGMFYISTNELFPNIIPEATAEPVAAASNMSSSASADPFGSSTSKTFVITGHRPRDLGRDENYNIFDPIYDDIRGFFEKYFQAAINKYGLQNVIVISGMAQGTDQIAADLASRMGIRLHAYIPYHGQERSWSDANSVKVYMDLLGKATVTDVGEGVRPKTKEEAREMLLARNRAMVDDGDQVLAVFNGSMSGGTAACIRYANKRNVYVVGYNPINRKITNDLRV